MSNPEKLKEIPVLTVWKNNTILKNIFLINKNNQESDYRVFEETLVVGRHPDCEIRLEHPSVSRFHLKIHSLPSDKLLFVTDLSSVHGTWVSGRRIEPNIKTTVKEGEHLRIGGSSRVYKLHWIPLSQAYDVAKPFVPSLDFPDIQEDDDEVIKDEISVELKDEKVHNVDNFSDDISLGSVSVDLCGEDQMIVEKVIPQSPPLQPQKHVLVKDEATEVADLEPQCVDVVSRELEQIEMLQPSPVCNADFENDDVQSVDSILEGLVVPCLKGDMSRDPEQKEMLLVPLIHNEDSENEDVQSMDSILEGLAPLFMGENWEWISSEENYLPCATEDHPHLSEVDGTAVFTPLDDNLELSVPLLAENMNNFIDDAWSFWCGSHVAPSSPAAVRSLLNSECQSLVHPILEGLDTLVLDENSEVLAEKVTSSAPLMSGVTEFSSVGNVDKIKATERREVTAEIIGEDIQESAWSFWRCTPVASTFPATVDGFVNTECHHPGIEKELLESVSSDLNSSAKKHEKSELWSFWSGKMGVESVCSAFSDAEPFSESEYKSLTAGYSSSPLGSLKSQEDSSLMTSDQKSGFSFLSERSSSDAEPFSESEKESFGDCYQRRLGRPLRTSDLNPLDSIWRRGRETEERKMMTDKKNVENEPLSRVLFHESSDQEVEEAFTPDAENITPTSRKPVRKFAVLKEINNSNSVKSPLSKMTHVPNYYYDEEDVTPNKENISLTMHKSMRKSAVLKEISNSSSGKSPFVKMSSSPYNRYEGIISPSSNKENLPPRSRQREKTARRASANKVESVKLKARKGDRVPFQSLLENSPQRSLTECHAADTETKSGESVKRELRQWNMVVDTSTLLNKESRKALQLLEGLKGSQLIIPKIVISELTSLKRKVSFFRRNTEVLSALEWIQDCMLKTGWWIHVQNSTEEGRPVAPTSPATPHSRFCCGISGSDAFSGCEALSPTVEDDVLDFALGFRNKNRDGQLVLLSNDVTMKIKAMAEGMICETAEEFRESLVNPFSSRFRWTDCSPRGRTWSCADDFVLKENFYPTSLTMKCAGNVRGLKLLLLHNSLYPELMTAVH